ncbi:MAG TPA: hypothetical protein VE173_10135, partial [Longimicrobiales bacterium]|nr:hypothetical protein [Longimicrobiales bacterium]
MDPIRPSRAPLLAFAALLTASCGGGVPITAAGRPGRLDVRAAGEHSVRVTLRPVDDTVELPYTPALAERDYPEPVISLRSLGGEIRERVGSLDVVVRPDPLTVRVSNDEGELVQEIAFPDDGTLTFRLGDQPVLGMGEGGPRPPEGADWRELPIELDRRGRVHAMQPRWQSGAYGSRNPVAFMVGTGGWGLWVATPWG